MTTPLAPPTPLEQKFPGDGSTKTWMTRDLGFADVSEVEVLVRSDIDGSLHSAAGKYTATIVAGGGVTIVWNEDDDAPSNAQTLIVRNAIQPGQPVDFDISRGVDPASVEEMGDRLSRVDKRLAGDIELLKRGGFGGGGGGILGPVEGGEPFTAEDHAKLDGIEEGADVNPTGEEIAALIPDNMLSGAKLQNETVTLDKLNTTGSSRDQVLAIGDDGEPTWKDEGEVQVDNSAIDARITAGVKDYARTGGRTIDTDDIDAAAITEPKIADNSIGDNKIKDGAVETSKIEDGAVTTEKVEDMAITTEKIAPNAITTGLIATGGVGHTDIAQGAVGSVSISSQAVTSDKIANDAVITSKIQDGAVTLDKLGSDVPVGSGGASTTFAYDYIGTAQSGGHRSADFTPSPLVTNLRVHTSGGTATNPDKISLPLFSNPDRNQDRDEFWAFYGLRDYLGYMGSGTFVKLGDATYKLTGNETERTPSGFAGTIFEYEVTKVEGAGGLPAENEGVAIEVYDFPRPGSEAPTDLNRFIPGVFVLRGAERNGPSLTSSNYPAELVNAGVMRNMLQVVRGARLRGVQHTRNTHEGGTWDIERIDPDAFTDGDVPIDKISHTGATASQVLAVNSSASGLEWVDAVQGGEAAVIVDGRAGDSLATIRIPQGFSWATNTAPQTTYDWTVTTEGTSSGLSINSALGHEVILPHTPQIAGQIGWWLQLYNDTTQNSDADLLAEAFVPFGSTSRFGDVAILPSPRLTSGTSDEAIVIRVTHLTAANHEARFSVATSGPFTMDGLPIRIWIRAATLTITGSVLPGPEQSGIARGHATGSSKTDVDNLELGAVVFPGNREDVMPAGMPPACDENGGVLYTVPQVQQTFTSFNGGKVISRTWLGSAWGHWVDITEYPASHTKHTTTLVNEFVPFGISCPANAWKLPRVVGSPWSERNMDDYRLVLTLARPTTENRLGESSQPGYYFAPTHGIHTRETANWHGNQADGADRAIAHQNISWKEVYGNGIVDSDGYAIRVSRTGSSHPELHGVIGFKDSNPNFHHISTFAGGGVFLNGSASASNRAFQELAGLPADAFTGHTSRERGLLVLAETAHKGNADSYAAYLQQLTRNAYEVFFTNRVDRADQALRFSAGLQPTSSEPFFLINSWRDGNSSTEHGLAVHRNSHVNKHFLLHVTRDRNADGGAQKWIPDNNFSENYYGFKSVSRLDIPNLIPTGTHRINTEAASPWIELPDTVAHATKLLFLVDYDPSAADYNMRGIQDNFILSRRGKSWSRYDLGHYAAGFHNNADAAADSRYRVGFRKNASEVKVWTQNGTSFYTYGLYILEEEGE